MGVNKSSNRKQARNVSMSLAQTLIPNVQMNSTNQRIHTNSKIPMNNTMNMHIKQKSELPTGAKDIFSKKDAFGNNIASG